MRPILSIEGQVNIDIYYIIIASPSPRPDKFENEKRGIDGSDMGLFQIEDGGDNRLGF
jgi:hypothetical protein